MFTPRQKIERLTAIDRFVIARGQAYFKLAFFSGDRPGDLGEVKVPEILRFPNDDGFLFNHIWGKTLRDGDENVLGVRRNVQAQICPIRGIERYMEVMRDTRVDLMCGYLFPPITPDLGIKDAPFTSSATESHLKGYLKEMNANNGKTLHGFPSSCVITLALTGADLAEIMDHVVWTRCHTALYYMQLAKVLNPAGASAQLASNIGIQPSCSWQDINQLKRFVCAFLAVSHGRDITKRSICEAWRIIPSPDLESWVSVQFWGVITWFGGWLLGESNDGLL